MNLIKISLIAILLFACSDSDKVPDRFRSAYEEIIFAREYYSEDTLRANEEVNKVFEKYNYSEPEFREEYFKISENRELFIAFLDSVRLKAKTEVENVKRAEIRERRKKDAEKDSTSKDVSK